MNIVQLTTAGSLDSARRSLYFLISDLCSVLMDSFHNAISKHTHRQSPQTDKKKQQKKSNSVEFVQNYCFVLLQHFSCLSSDKAPSLSLPASTKLLFFFTFLSSFR